MVPTHCATDDIGEWYVKFTYERDGEQPIVIARHSPSFRCDLEERNHDLQAFSVWRMRRMVNLADPAGETRLRPWAVGADSAQHPDPVL